ncbi:hypothetical protein LEP1GSC161_1397 [Leptospira santarosai str. CBC1416]|uniref:Uncharacterized protein n=1 Tax=Leptospira santarosai str. CBC1416 TaxID=1193059 RepID=M6VK15_9LEPT|nr:hypothetical protein LEP1GSC175_2681 [Leptospira santarosai str. HAI821]EMO57160.1 hypothetical protein LEP1GSC161_1397 [Leptospira santarosai str. CBC1416]EMP01065.1 hypothetical protein LEP1GSC171_3556 [Leptospira santarosai str. HAI1380]
MGKIQKFQHDHTKLKYEKKTGEFSFCKSASSSFLRKMKVEEEHQHSVDAEFRDRF